MASGDLLAAWRAGDNDYPASAAAPISRAANYGYFANIVAAADSYIIFEGIMGPKPAAAGVTVAVDYLMDSANVGAVAVLSAAFQNKAPGLDLSAPVVWDANTVNESVPNAAEFTAEADIPFTDGADMDSVEANGFFRLRVGGLRSDVADTALGAVRLLGVRIFET